MMDDKKSMDIPNACASCDGETDCMECDILRQRELAKLGSIDLGITHAIDSCLEEGGKA